MNPEFRMDPESVPNVLDLLRKSEYLGENVLRDRMEIVCMDRTRQKNREALSALKRYPNDENVYLCIGNMFIKHKIRAARSLIEKDQNNVERHIEELRQKVKKNVQEIQEIEGRAEEFKGFNLNPLDQSEMKGFNVMLDTLKKLDTK